MSKLENHTAFLRIYVGLMGAMAVLNIFLRPLTGSSYFHSLFIFALICLPVTLLLMFILNQIGDTLSNTLFGFGRREHNISDTIESEITKLIELKEQEEYHEMLFQLKQIEEQYGVTSRLIHERAHCLIELGESRKARRCIKDYLTTTPPNSEDAYRNYCSELINNDLAPLTLDNILKAEQQQPPSL